MNSSPLQTMATSPVPRRNLAAWYRPIFSPEHGVYVILGVSFSIGAAAAAGWNWSTTLALLCAYCGFQAEHPLVLQIKQRHSWKPRFLVWAGLYGGVALTIALVLAWQFPLLVWIYVAAIAAFLVDAVSVFHREQKSIVNELITFAAVCLSTPLAYIATTGTLQPEVWGLWLLNTLFFASAIFTVKFRKDKTHPLWPGLTYHVIATFLVAITWWVGGLAPLTALAFGVVLGKFAVILWQRQWYCTTPIQFVAMLETGSALLFLAIVALSVLPVHLPG